MTDTMINRITTAMQESPAWPAVFDAGTAETLARVALETVREPTEAMLVAAMDDLDWWLTPHDAGIENLSPLSAEDADKANRDMMQSLRSTARAMIDAALSETT